ncbi:hypothetical protein [Serratia marcescens]|uniref:hypothetical protein n=1 Tax=Serratia marcescens TaxID=615 RepID=UPI001F154262|nr:hypothetical protein [Serratia marcescens]
MKLAPTQLKGTTDALFNKTTAALSRVSPFGAGLDYDGFHDKAFAWMDEIKSPGALFTSPLTPADLRKSQVRTIRSKNGMAISGLTLAEDWTFGAEAGIKTIPLALMLAGVITTATLATSMTAPMVAGLIGLGIYRLVGANFGELLIGTLLAGGAAYASQTFGGSNTLIGAATFLLPAAVIYLGNYLAKKGRANALLEQSRYHTNTLGDDDKLFDKLKRQITQAIKDDAKAPFLKLAKATGTFQRKGAFECPDAGTEIGVNFSDLAQHMFYMGKPGTGKSYALRKAIKEAYLACKKMGKNIGMLLLDGKGELAFECRKILDLIVHPSTVENFCLVEGVNATKFTSIMQTINNVKMEGPNADFARAGLELVYNAALAHQFLRDIVEADPIIAKSWDFKWSYMYRYNLMSTMLEPGQWIEKKGNQEFVPGRGNTLAQVLTYHPDFGTDPRIEQLILSIEGELSEERQEFAMKYLKNAQGYMQAVLQEENIIRWANSETSSINVLDVLKGKKIGVALPPERFGIAGAFVTQLIKASVRNGIANRDNTWRNDSNNTEILMVQDEFQDLFSETDDLNNIPKDRSRGCYNLAASQTVSAIRSKISNTATADYLFANFASFVSLKTADKTADELMQQQAGTVKVVRVNTPAGKAIAFRETAQDLVSRPEFDPTHPDAKMFKKFRTDIEFNVYDEQKKSIPGATGLFSAAGSLVKFLVLTPLSLVMNTVGRHVHYFSTYSKDEKQEYAKLLSDDMFNELDLPQHAVCIFKRGGMWVKDIATLYGVDPEFNDV